MDLSKVEIVISKDGIEVPVPKGYVASSIESEMYVNGLKTYDENGNIIDTQYGGFVIYEGNESVTEENAWEAQTSRNQWVWIPILDVSDMYCTSETNIFGNNYKFAKNSTILISSSGKNEPAVLVSSDTQGAYLSSHLNGISRNEFLVEMQQNFCEMLESIATYKGFYIGRYETGNLSKNIPVVQKMNTDISDQTWYTMYKKCKKIAGNNQNVVTSMIWGIQYDETLKWLIETGNKTYKQIASDSTEWGNYYNSTFTYTTTDGKTAVKNPEIALKIPTGASEYTKANNIYDLAGNVLDWTLEYSKRLYRSSRGGGYAYESDNIRPAGYRSIITPYSNYLHLGCRAMLYIK